jgi:ribosome maturation factor RimP
MIAKDKIEKLVKTALTDNMFLVDIHISNGNKIVIFIDSPEGITINNCGKISRIIEGELDETIENYELEVSSPGITRPFKVIHQYHKNIGKEIEVLKNDGNKLKGRLTGVEIKGINIEIEKEIKSRKAKKKERVIERQFIEFEKIKHTKLVLSY